MFIVTVIASTEIAATQAYDLLEGPLMALIGGSLAISKDLVPLGETDVSNSKHPDAMVDGEGNHRKEGEAH